ncbi:adrenodoxin-like protein 1, mitochondrial [Quercus lobata]|uniref:adrenodoxin-like protein 1, mitochondrial n=1 Tax=Quercus lobata TaxID=97700 RepID=UPI0012464FC6|nr:adrenodoxin-like protein 1, mitochondrial [Quercus lobata]
MPSIALISNYWNSLLFFPALSSHPFVQFCRICVTFIEKDGEEKVINVPIGMSMLEAALKHDIDIEGACEGSCACSTCHVIVQDMEYYNKLEDPTDEENDMLDLAFGLTEKIVISALDRLEKK